LSACVLMSLSCSVCVCVCSWILSDAAKALWQKNCSSLKTEWTEAVFNVSNAFSASYSKVLFNWEKCI